MGKILNDVQTELALYVAGVDTEKATMAIAEPGGKPSHALRHRNRKEHNRCVIVVCPRSLVMVWQQEVASGFQVPHQHVLRVRHTVVAAGMAEARRRARHEP